MLFPFASLGPSIELQGEIVGAKSYFIGKNKEFVEKFRNLVKKYLTLRMNI